MSRAVQADLFAGQPVAAPSYLPDPAKVRAKLHSVLAKAKAAPEREWSEKDRSFYETVFPQMTNWLPKDEATSLCAEFDAQLARLEALA